MKNEFVLPNFPEVPHIPAPMVYVKESQKIAWEYKAITRDLTKEQMPTEEDLNTLGREGWELAGTCSHETLVYFYFKRLLE